MPAGSRASARLSDSVVGIAILAITGMQLMSTLDGTIAIVALPRMQADLDLSDASKSWVITGYALTFGGLLLLGGRIGDAVGRKRAFLSGVGVFTIASLVCGLANDQWTLIAARAVQGAGAAVAAPTGLALIATTYAVGHARNQALAVSAAMQGLGSVLGLVLGGALTALSWRLAFLVNVPIGLIIIWIAVTRIAETQHERLKLDITGALLATLGCSAAVLVFTQGPPRGWVDPWVIGASVAVVVFFVAFLFVERSADNPLVPFAVFDNTNRVMTFVSLFLAGGVMLTLTVMIGLLVQDVLGYSPLRAGLCFMPFALAFVIGNVLATRMAPVIAPRWLILGGGVLVLAAMLFGSTLSRGIPYFPDLVTPLVVGGLADDSGSDLVEHGLDGLLDTLAAVAGPAVAKLDGLMLAGGRTGRDRGAGEGAVDQCDLDLDRRVAARIEDLPGADLLDDGHCRLLMSGLSCSVLSLKGAESAHSGWRVAEPHLFSGHGESRSNVVAASAEQM